MNEASSLQGVKVSLDTHEIGLPLVLLHGAFSDRSSHSRLFELSARFYDACTVMRLVAQADFEH